MHLYLDTVVSSTPDYSAGIYMRVTFMSFTMAWNNPPSAPHSFSTVSMVAKKKTAKSVAGRGESGEISVCSNGFKHQMWRSEICSSALSCPLFGASSDSSRKDAHTQQPTERTDTQKNPETILFSFDGTGSRRSPRSAAATRLSGAREGWSRDALQPGSWKGTCGSDRRDRGANRNNRENTMC